MFNLQYSSEIYLHINWYILLPLNIEHWVLNIESYKLKNFSKT